jgi:hypothetical protein
MIKLWLLPIIPMFVFMYCWGGQVRNWMRRYVLPVSVMLLTMAYFHYSTEKHWYMAIPALLFIPDFVEGYGEKSWLFKLFKVDWETRMAYGFMCALTIAGEAVWQGHYWACTAVMIEPVLYLMEFSSWGKIGKYDILGDDVVRALGLSAYWIVAVI